METILGKAPAIFNGHQPPRAVDPYMPVSKDNDNTISCSIQRLLCWQLISEQVLKLSRKKGYFELRQTTLFMKSIEIKDFL